MNISQKIVLVSASFEEGDGLFNWLKKYGRSHDDRHVYFDEFAFTPYPRGECDAVLVFNTPSAPIQTRCYPEQTLAFMMEPGVRGQHPWMFRQLEQYAAVYSPLPHSGNTVLSHGFLGWYLPQDLDTLQQWPPPVKTRQVSCIASGLKQLEGHRLRLGFVRELQNQLPEVDIYGKGSRYLADKTDGLLPYRYSIAIENASLPYYFTEKINDCFLSWTVPLYYGCRNLERFFPEKSFIRIDIRDREKTFRLISELLARDDWAGRLDALREARELVLQRYQPLAGAAQILRSIPPTIKQNVVLNPARKSVTERLQQAFYKLVHPA